MFGITNNKVRDHLLREKSLTLECTLEICHANEVYSAQQKAIDKINNSTVHAIGRGKKVLNRETWRRILGEEKRLDGYQTASFVDENTRNPKKLAHLSRKSVQVAISLVISR